ncbi:MAG: PQQ-dependent sugar dehydrogenase [Gemmataceae bacterium]
MTPLVLATAVQLVGGLTNPESVAVAPDGKVYVSVVGEREKADGMIVRLENGKAVPFATGLTDPRGRAAYQKWLFVADNDRVWRIDMAGKPTLLAGPDAFPTPPKMLNDVTVDPESGTVFVTDMGDRKGAGGAVYKITSRGKPAVAVVTDHSRWPGLHSPNGLAMDGQSFLLLADSGTGELHRVKVADGSHEKLADGLGAPDGIAWDHFGRLFVSDYKGGRVFVIARPGAKPELLAEKLGSANDLCYDPATRRLLVPNLPAGTVVALPATVPSAPVDETPLPIATEVAFPNLKWAGWTGETESGRPLPLRPIVLTHPNDGTNRVFVATQQGVIHVFANDQGAASTKVFLDISARVQYDDRTNEEGLLGLAFHPRYKETGEFFVYYTPKNPKKQNLVARFKVSKDDPDRADPASEQEVLRYTDRPFWNHDGGTIAFGPDGMLYVTHGDGGAANDPHENGQKMSTWFGKILRVDVDKKADGKGYSVPADNPFVNTAGAKPEIWALGVRNIWRMAFDKPTGKLWAADVGQNLYEEIDLIEKGKNYGWNRREGLHPFGAKGSGVKPEFAEPIWEYHHDIGRSITGGQVYRGTRLPELAGHYLYADYVSSKIWALKHDDAAGRVVANRPIKDPSRPVLSFGEGPDGDVYFLIVAQDGKGIYRFTRTETGAK